MQQKHAVVYIRVSTDDQKQGLSLEVQEQLCIKHAENAGYEVIEVLNDGGMSGFKERAGIKKIQEYIKEGKISAVVALSSDRLFRNTSAHIEMMRLVFEREVHVLYVHQASPENNATSIMSDSLLAVANQFYRDQTSDKVKATLYAKVEAGYFPSMPPPGYRNADRPDATDRFGRKVIEPHPVMAPLITELFRLYATGAYSVYDLTEVMNKKGLQSYRGYPISPNRVFDLLRNRVYIGEVKWGKAFTKNGKHEPLIDEATFNRVQAVLDTKNHKASRRRKHKWLLSGFVYCARHGKRYVAEWH